MEQYQSVVPACPPKCLNAGQARLGTLLSCLLLPFFLLGCNSFGNAKLVQELRTENDRLLAEFRAERDRRQEAEQQQRLVESRLAESEKLLAQSYGGTQSNRLSSLPRYDQPTSSGRSGISSESPGFSSISPSAGIGTGQGDPGLRWQSRLSQ